MTLPATSFTEARPKSFRISSKRDALGPSREVLLGPRVKAQSILAPQPTLAGSDVIGHRLL